MSNREIFKQHFLSAMQVKNDATHSIVSGNASPPTNYIDTYVPAGISVAGIVAGIVIGVLGVVGLVGGIVSFGLGSAITLVGALIALAIMGYRDRHNKYKYSHIKEWFDGEECSGEHVKDLADKLAIQFSEYLSKSNERQVKALADQCADAAFKMLALDINVITAQIHLEPTQQKHNQWIKTKAIPDSKNRERLFMHRKTYNDELFEKWPVVRPRA